MKKFLTFAALFAVSAVCMVLSSCAKSVGKEEPVKFFTADAEIIWNNESYEAQIKRISDTDWVIAFTKPKSLKDLSVEIQSGETSLNFKGLKFTFNAEKYNLEGFADTVTSVLNAVCTGAVEMFDAEDCYTATGTYSGFEYKAEFDKDTLVVRLVECEEIGLKIELNNVETIVS